MLCLQLCFSDPYIGSQKRLMLRIDNEFVYISFGGQTKRSDYMGSRNETYTINNGKWYYVTVTYNGMSGEMTIYINSVKVGTMTNGVGVMLPK